ncbi:BamA/TamA family outer membrane protein [uncultured Ilyobacter sp.]|uniref:BamA/OMP85 family outer membrane protein n=1 Tax=uncultured Ilyobacter sp. TaxID=544433 RepID=UPI0029C08E39|nr:BamA/TamA family outer membrane protein [uncultured Ilyobacter sp.]
MRKQLLVLLTFLFSLLAFGEDANYLVKEIEVTNNREVPIEVVQSVMESKVGENYSTEKMVEDYKRIKNLSYIENVVIYPKLYDAGIKLSIEIQEKNDSKKILENSGIIPLSERENIDKSLVVNSIEIYGNRYISRQEILNMIPVKTGGYFSKRKVLDGQKNIINSGYFREVTPEVYKYGEGVLVRYTLTENPVITGINIYGNTVYSTEELKKGIKTEPGKIYNLNTLREDKDGILAKYHEAGYALTELANIGLNDSYELEIYLSEGVIRDIQFRKMVTKQKGARRKATDNVLKTKDYVIERNLEFKVGEVFDYNKYQESIKNLMRSGNFKNIKPEYKTIPGDPDGRIVVMLFDEERTASLQGSLSYGSEVGFLGSLSVKDTNYKGKAQNFGVTYEKSDSDYSKFSLDFQDPWIKDTDRISWGWSLYKSQYEDDDSELFYDVNTYGFKVNAGKGITKNVRVSLGTKVEYVTEDDEDGDRTDDYGLTSIFPAITYDTRNHFWSPTEGEYAKLQLEGGYAGGYDADAFGNITLELRKYHRGFWKTNTFAYRAIGGIMTDSTKESQRFRVGGGSTLRGYDGGYYKGTEKLTFTVENRSQINDILGFVLFVDAGRAWDQDGRDTSYEHDGDFPDDIGVGAGVGMRLNTPLGPLRFDFGWPVGDTDESGMQFYFNMGHTF